MSSTIETSTLGKFLDWAAYQISPQWGARRAIARTSYGKAARRLAAWGISENRDSSPSSWMTSLDSPDSDLSVNLKDMQDRALALYKTDGYAHGAVECRVANEVGNGIRFHSRLRDDEIGVSTDEAVRINERIEDGIEQWSRLGCDRTRTESLSAVQRVVTRGYANYGEFFVELAADPSYDSPFPLILDLIDPFRIETPPNRYSDPLVRMGVRYDSKGRVVGYYVRDSHPGDHLARTNEYRFVPRVDRNGYVRMAHVFERLFAGQSRGIPWLAAAANRIKDIRDYSEASVIAAQVEACAMGFVRTAEGTNPFDVATKAADSTDSRGQRLEKMRPAQMYYLNEGEDVQLFDPARPGSNFAPFMEWALRSMAASINFPYELLAKNFFRTTYSSGRLGMLDGRVGMKMRVASLVEKLLYHIGRRAVLEMVLTGWLDGYVSSSEFLANRTAYERHVWQCQSTYAIDPEKEFKSQDIAVRGDLSTVAESVGERGVDPDEHWEQRRREKLRVIEQDVEMRKRRWELEEAAGLPHMEEDQQQDQEDDDAVDSPSREEEEAPVG